MAHLRELLLAGSLIVGAAAGTVPASASQYVQPGLRHGICPREPVGYSTCFVRVLGSGSPNGAADAASGNLEGNLASPQNSAPSGLPPSAITTAYGFPTTGGSGETIAVVDAFDDPTVASNLTTFSNEYGLPACTVTDGCLTKVNQSGGTSYPTVTSGWALEISLDVEWAHALAPKARVLLVEATSASDANLFDAVTYAAQHAQYVSMSWGGAEFSGETGYDADLSTPGVSFFAAAGDSGESPDYPSTSPDVISVGGTTLSLSSTYQWLGETAWSDGGGGCSAYEAATAAQAAFPTYDQAGAGCAALADGAPARATPDVALDANPSSGVSVYDSVSYDGESGWFTVGGTSASTVMWAARSAAAAVEVNSSYVYGANIPLYNVTTGSNGAPCETGYNLCTGLGSWNETHGSVNSPLAGSLSFSPNAQTLTAGSASAPMAVQLTSAAPAGLAVSLSTTSSGGGFSDSASGPFTSTLTVDAAPGADTSGTFYYQDTVAGSPTLTATASDWKSATQTETVDPAALASVTVTPSSASVATGGSQVFDATGYDRFGNQVMSGFDPSWSTGVAGAKVSPSSGTSTTFTAGTETGSGSVTATQGTVTASAAVSVTGLATMAVSVSAGSTVTGGLGYETPLTVTVTGRSGPLSRATVTLDVYAGTCSGSLVASGGGTTGSQGRAAFEFSTRTTGTYCARATVTATGYTSGTGSTSFTISGPAGRTPARSGDEGRLTLR